MMVQYSKMQKTGKNTQTENHTKQIRQQIKRRLEENKQRHKGTNTEPTITKKLLRQHTDKET